MKKLNFWAHKAILAILCAFLACTVCFGFAACGEKEPPEPTKYTVTFDANGGVLTGNATVSIEKDAKITGAPTASKEGNTFTGWFTEKTAGTEVKLAEYTVTKDVTLYAQYKQNEVKPTTYTVTFDANGGVLTGNATVTVEKDAKITNAPTASKEGSTFTGWFTQKSGGTEVKLAEYTVTDNVTLYAQYQVDKTTYTVTFDANGGVLTGEATLTVEENAKITGAPTASKEGNVFTGWFTEKTGGTQVDLDTYTVTKDVTLYAQYEEDVPQNPPVPYDPATDPTMPLKKLMRDGEQVGYRIEAEESQIEGTQSSENQSGTGFLEKNIETASGKTSVGYLGVAGNTLTFTFYAEKAGKALIALYATSNNTKFDMSAGFTMWVDDQTVTTKDFTVAFNGEAVNFAPQKLRGAGAEKPSTWNLYWDPVSFGNLIVKAGFNKLVITVAAQTVPNMDCLDILTSLNITSADGTAASGEAEAPAPIAPPAEAVVYEKNVSVKFIVGGYAGGPAIEKAILTFEDEIPAAAIAENPFTLNLGGALGGKNDKVYLCDEAGEKTDATNSRYVAIEYAVSYAGWSFEGNLSPFAYNKVNQWKDFTTATLGLNKFTLGEKTYTEFGGTLTVTKEVPCLEGWDTTGTYKDGDINLTYGFYAPQDSTKTGKKPLIVWLHGAGEGGTNPEIAILGNQVTNLSKPLIQKYFTTDTVAGAYVLAPQSPTMWMDNGSGQQGDSNVGDSIYTESLFKLIQKFVTDHTDIDANRVYIGGCSNGGWMTIEMLSKHGEFFAAAFPIAVPFDKDAGLTEEEFARLVNVPMWITHAQADNTVKIAEIEMDYSKYPEITTTIKANTETNSNQLYIELLKAGATNVHYTLFKTVTVEGVTYDGHWSWIFTLRDECMNVQSTKEGFALTDLNPDSTAKVQVGGKDVSLWGWIAAQSKQA